MTKADQAVESAADKLEQIVEDARRSGGLKAKVGDTLADDPDFLRKLKPSLMAARAKGELPTNEPAGSPPRGPSGPQLPRARKAKAKKRRGLSPWLVIGAAVAAGYVAAKVIDWRAHAHPRF
jgi:hypothetical protein